MHPETLVPPPAPGSTDEQAVAAVRQGDLRRYRELVERHQRLVFGIAWSRLGDASLAEDAAQEAFIRGFRYLPMLDSGAKFPAWISAIARNVAIAFGLKHRRELKRRERWALEQPAAVAPVAVLDEPGAPATLRRALAELPAIHRECLVLFYLEGKSGAETAAALGLEEAALRMRLMRARAALRQHLEKRLGDSLEQLRPSRTLVPSVMAAVAGLPAGQAGGAGVGTTLLAALGKMLPFKFLSIGLGLIGILPGLWLTSWLGREERKNYRDAEGFRPRLHREFSRRFLWGFPLVVVASWAATSMLQHLGGIQFLFTALGVFSLGLAALSVRQYQLVHNRFSLSQLIYVVGTGAAELAVAVSLAMGSGMQLVLWFSPFMAVASLVLVAAQRDRPVRMDYSLFLRAAEHLLPPSREQIAEPSSLRLSKDVLWAFGRFLGQRFLVVKYRWREDGLVLGLPPMRPSFLQNMLNLFRPVGDAHSRIVLGWDGSVNAHCSKEDEQALLSAPSSLSRLEAETQVSAAVAQAWQTFRQDNVLAAEQAVGQVPDAEIFVVPVSRTPAFRKMQWIMLGLAAVSGALFLFAWFLGRGRTSSRALAPVTASAGQVQAALADWAEGISKPGAPPNLWYGNVYTSYLLPAKESFAPAAFQQVKARLLADSSRPESAGLFAGLSFVQEKALALDWLAPAELGATPASVHGYFKALNPGTRDRMLRLKTIPVQNETYTILNSEQLLWQLLWLRKVDSLDLIEPAPIVAQLRASQVLSETPLPGRHPLKEWKTVRGLFITAGWDPLHDTYEALSILEVLGGLGQIDHEACIQGILRFHQGQGLFGAPMASDHPVLLIWGDARDTFCAFESLRILHALDRVPDLGQWKFRPMDASAPAQPRVLTWDEIEAWVAQQRLTRDLREHAANPAAPYRSLLDP